MAVVDREFRDWLRGLAVPSTASHDDGPGAMVLSDQAADYLARIATDGTLKAALAEIAASEPELAG
jgi:hypothetical protein